MNIKQVLASGIINIGGLLSKKATVSLIKETNAVRLVPFKWLAEYLKHHASLRGVVQYVDVGTNDGLEMGQLLNSVGPFKSVHAIEPNPIIVEQLRNRFPSVCLHQLALGNCDTEAKLIVPLDIMVSQ